MTSLYNYRKKLRTAFLKYRDRNVFQATQADKEKFADAMYNVLSHPDIFMILKGGISKFPKGKKIIRVYASYIAFNVDGAVNGDNETVSFEEMESDDLEDVGDIIDTFFNGHDELRGPC